MSDILICSIIFSVFLLFLFGSNVTSDRTIRNRMEKEKKRAMHPPVDSKLIKTKPAEGDFILGRQGSKYVCWNTKNDGHILIIGGSGSGKSSCYIIPFLLYNPNATVFAIDIKGELVEKGKCRNDPRVCVFSPCDRNGYGFNPFYALTEESSEQDILVVMQTITFSLIPLGNEKDKSKHDLQADKDYCNELCREYGFTVAEKGKHFDGSEMEAGEITSWNKDTYRLLTDCKKGSYLADCGIAVINAVNASTSKDEFIDMMESNGWSVKWSNKRRHITFINSDGKKIRDKTLLKHFRIDVSKEALSCEFDRARTRKSETKQSDTLIKNGEGKSRTSETGRGFEKKPRGRRI